MPAANQKNIQKWLGRYFEHEGHDPVLTSKVLAKEIAECRLRKTVDKILEHADTLMNANGIEAIRGAFHGDSYYQDIVALYVNTGDTYEPTLLFNTVTGGFVVTTFGDWVETYSKKYRIE
jgi:hypothetical protein